MKNKIKQTGTFYRYIERCNEYVYNGNELSSIFPITIFKKTIIDKLKRIYIVNGKFYLGYDIEN